MAMPYTLTYEPDHDVVIGMGSGNLGYLEALEGAVSLWEHREWKGKSVVWDFRTAHFDLSGESVQELAEFVTRHQPLTRPPRVAMVVADDFNYGVARMYEAFRADLSTEVRVFQVYEDAVAWAAQVTSVDREGDAR